MPGAGHSGYCGGTSGCSSVALPAVGPAVGSCLWGAAFQSAADIPEECQAKATSRARTGDVAAGSTATPQCPCTRARADPPPGALTGSAVFYLLLTCLANNAVELWSFGFLNF